MTDDRLMAMARAAGYSMIPPQDAFETGPDAGADADTAGEPGAADISEAAPMQRFRHWIGQSSGSVSTMRDAVSNWYHGRAHA